VSGWAELGLVVGVVAGALVAALLVVAAVRDDVLAPQLRGRAVQVLGLLLSALLGGVVLTLVRQPPAALGGELVVLGVLAGTAAVLIGRDPRSAPRVFDVGTPNLVAAALTAAAGICLLVGEEGGLYLLVVSLLGSLVGAVVGVWLLLVRLADRPARVTGPAAAP
jgi:hypothetical protein